MRSARRASRRRAASCLARAGVSAGGLSHLMMTTDPQSGGAALGVTTVWPVAPDPSGSSNATARNGLRHLMRARSPAHRRQSAPAVTTKRWPRRASVHSPHARMITGIRSCTGARDDVRLGRDDRVGLHALLRRRVAPPLPEAGQRKQRLVLHADAPLRLVSLLAAPLEKRIERNQAVPLRIGGAKGGGRGDGLRSAR